MNSCWRSNVSLLTSLVYLKVNESYEPEQNIDQLTRSRIDRAFAMQRDQRVDRRQCGHITRELPTWNLHATACHHSEIRVKRCSFVYLAFAKWGLRAREFSHPFLILWFAKSVCIALKDDMKRRRRQWSILSQTSLTIAQEEVFVLAERSHSKQNVIVRAYEFWLFCNTKLPYRRRFGLSPGNSPKNCPDNSCSSGQWSVSWHLNPLVFTLLRIRETLMPCVIRD